MAKFEDSKMDKALDKKGQAMLDKGMKKKDVKKKLAKKVKNY